MGRPRKHPVGTTATTRKALSRAALVEAGGVVKQYRLSARAAESLDLIRRAAADATETALIERLLETERNRLLNDPVP